MEELGSALFEQVVRNAGEGIVIADVQGNIRFWNEGARGIFGFSAEEAMGQSLDIIIPIPQRPRHWAGYDKVMATGVTHYGHQLLAVPALKADGSRISIAFTVVLLRDATGNMSGIGAIVRDVTEAWEKDRALRRRVAELEALQSATPGA